ncbi:hypothetical protein B0H16DRAFT_1596538 [Mycena metata]|uniref:MYND-type domain-containing protein n=1 Tax=Mycena metata TaxID=1033252 RepID=A0AAD7MMH1_9AGAR|nr:hypothetical protein B0H16DRAFT_1596538 [Mycena metata]
MHSSLRSSLQSLPESAKRVALGVCVRHPTALDLARYGALYLKTPPAQLLSFLSVHHVLVDPARIPTQEQLDPLSSAAKIAIEAAMLSIEALFKTKIPSAARSDLWPRVFVWVQFIQTFRELLSDLKFVMASEEDLCVGFVTFSRDISENLSVVEGLVCTPEFQVIATRGWACALQQTDSRKRSYGLGEVVSILGRSPTFVEEMLEGAGGSVDNLADLLIRQLRYPSVSADGTLSAYAVRFFHLPLSIISDFVRGIDPADPDNPGDMDIRVLRTMHSVYLALLARGLLKYATTAACALGQTGLSRSDNVQDHIGCIEAYIRVIVAAFKKQVGFRLIPDAINNGLLRAILALSKQEMSDRTSDLMVQLLVDILGPATAYHSVLIELRTALRNGLDTTGISRPQIYEAWKTFSTTVNGRLEVLTAFESTRHLSQRVCDNIECTVINDKRGLKRCSGCNQLLYCSPECQRIDWERGHRETCTSYRSQRTNVDVLGYTSRDRAFISFLVHHDYQAAQSPISVEIAHILVAKPDGGYCSYFNYTQCAVELPTTPLSPGIGDNRFNELTLSDAVRRASRSAGRMVVHVAFLREGRRDRAWIIPLRRATGEVHSALTRIAARSTGTAHIQREVGQLLRAKRGILEVHQVLSVSLLTGLRSSR